MFSERLFKHLMLVVEELKLIRRYIGNVKFRLEDEPDREAVNIEYLETILAKVDNVLYMLS